MSGVLVKQGSLERDTCTGRMPSEYEGRDCGDASASQGTSKIVRKPLEARRELEQIFSQSPQKEPALI